MTGRMTMVRHVKSKVDLVNGRYRCICIRYVTISIFVGNEVTD